jgi:pimeloyl-ACP methyl ester carboxylesterase
MATLHHHFALANGIRLHYVEAGSGPLVVLLHGFPEFWYSWRHQIPVLAAHGYRVIAPDLRGYNQSDKPAGLRPYRLDVLADDVAGLIAEAGADRATVVGHDWGGVIAWHLPGRHPGRVDRLAILNAPHPRAWLRELRRFEQRCRSAYILFFQLPAWPELLWRCHNFALLAHILRRQPQRPGAFSEEDIRAYKAALSQPGALTASLSYYRAAWRFQARRVARAMPPIQVPVLLVWGERDPYLGVRLTEDLAPWVPHICLQRLPHASHWVQNDAPEEVNRLLLDFLRQR